MEEQEGFDCIIVGIGSAGCALEHCPPADPACGVALPEAGGNDLSRWLHIRAGYFETMRHPAFDCCRRAEAGNRGRLFSCCRRVNNLPAGHYPG